MSRKAVILDSPVRLAARLDRPRSPWEIGIRYGAAYACTLIALAGAQLVVATPVILLLAALTMLGLPLSLALRRARRLGLMRLGGRLIPRPWINGVVMAITISLCVLLLGPGLPPRLSSLWDLSFATQTVRLLMQAFLIFGVCRCLAILNDKDAVLCTVPSFSVLLLLIVIHKGPEVVAFFALWAVACSALLSLDFRSDTRLACSASVPGLAPHQELKLSARGLAAVLGFSLSAAGILSYSLAGDDTGAGDDGWVSSLASRINGFALDLPDTSGNGGPERQIDFASLPSTPLRTPLWSVRTMRTDSWRVVRPQYWRLFTLSQYDGHSWSQASGPGTEVKIVGLDRRRWPLDPARRSIPEPPRSLGLRPLTEGRRRAYDIKQFGPAQARAPYFGAGAMPSSTSRREPGALGALGAPSVIGVREEVRALASNTGFVPFLPGATALRFQASESQAPLTVREREDASLDVGVMRRGSEARLQIEVAPLPEFGFALGKRPPSKRIAKPRLTLSAQEHARFLALPPAMPVRVKQWAQDQLRGFATDESNFRRSLRLAGELQKGAFYTLRPPLVPPNRDATDFFLFDSRRGYCTHFAGSLAATCRAVGIPSRIVSGFTNPEWDSGDRGIAELRESGSHAWVEIWEPGWGWALVDPTPPDNRGNNAPSLLQSWEELRGIVGEMLARNLAPIPLALPLLPAVLLLLALGLLRRARLSHDVRPQDASLSAREDALARAAISAHFARLSRPLARRFRPRAAWETPGEWLQAARQSLSLRDEEPLQTLFELYALALFSPHPLSPAHAQQARAALERLSWAKKARADSDAKSQISESQISESQISES